MLVFMTWLCFEVVPYSKILDSHRISFEVSRDWYCICVDFKVVFSTIYLPICQHIRYHPGIPFWQLDWLDGAPRRQAVNQMVKCPHQYRWWNLLFSLHSLYSPMGIHPSSVTCISMVGSAMRQLKVWCFQNSNW